MPSSRTASHSRPAPPRGAAFLPVLLLWATGCASMPDSAASLAWNDRWGDRVRGGLARDFEQCQALVETRQSQLSTCMGNRGWTLDR